MKNKKIKKIAYGLGALLIISAPGIGVLSCAEDKAKDKIQEINMNNVDSVQKFINILNDKMHFKTSKPTTVIGQPSYKPNTTTPIDPNGYPLTREQYKEIASTQTQDIKFKLIFNDKSQIFESHLNNDANIITTSINKMLDNQTTTGGQKSMEEMIKRMQEAQNGGPNFVSYVAGLATPLGMTSSGYLSLPDIAWNAYLHQLKEWTNFTSEINDSSVYKAWLQKNSNVYLIPKANLTWPDPFDPHYSPKLQLTKADLIDTSKINNKIDDGKTGINFDDNDKEVVKKLLSKTIHVEPDQLSKMNNLAVQFDFVMQDLYDLS